MKLFDVQENLGNDDCAINGRNTLNENIRNYTFDNFHGDGRNRDKLLDFTKDHNNLRFTDGYVPGGAIDKDTEFRTTNEWHQRGRQQLPARIYHAVPDLSRGDVQDDSGVRAGETTFDKASSLAGVSIDRFVPLIPQKEREVQDPNNIVSSDWVRGGQSTRDLTRTVAFITSDGFRRETPVAPWTA